MAMHSKTRISAQFALCAFLGIVTVLVVLAAPGGAKAQARKIELGDLRKVVNVSNPAISPNGKSILIVMSRLEDACRRGRREQQGRHVQSVGL
jgi:hypothetical protein